MAGKWGPTGARAQMMTIGKCNHHLVSLARRQSCELCRIFDNTRKRMQSWIESLQGTEHLGVAVIRAEYLSRGMETFILDRQGSPPQSYTVGRLEAEFKMQVKLGMFTNLSKLNCIFQPFLMPRGGGRPHVAE